jgi:hypothetical protein
MNVGEKMEKKRVLLMENTFFWDCFWVFFLHFAVLAVFFMCAHLCWQLKVLSYSRAPIISLYW